MVPLRKEGCRSFSIWPAFLSLSVFLEASCSYACNLHDCSRHGPPSLLKDLVCMQVAADLGDAIRIVKVDTDQNPVLSSELQIQGLPTMVFVSPDKEKGALRTEGLLPADVIKEIIEKEL